jgi:hypothetical protein
MDATDPDQATPTTSTLPAQRCAASSTEAASALQVLQPGAQNQKAVGRCAVALRSMLPPPTVGRSTRNASGTALAAPLAAATGLDEVSSPHAVTASTTAASSTIRRSTGVTVGSTTDR